MIRTWNRVRGNALVWTTKARRFFNTMLYDRCVYIVNGVAIFASAFHHRNGYEWALVADGKPYREPLPKDWSQDVLALRPYKKKPKNKEGKKKTRKGKKKNGKGKRKK